MEGEDRFSLLPDELLHHILSFLDTQMVIQTTSLLSKRWTNLWTSIPTLSFHYHSYSCALNDTRSDTRRLHRYSSYDDSKERCFRHFILGVLSRRTPRSKLTSLTSSHSNYFFECLYPHVDDLVSIDHVFFKRVFEFAALYHIQELCMKTGYVDFSACCSSLTTCRSVKLSGMFEGTWVPLTLTFLTSLEITNELSCTYMKLEGDIFPSCPLLERLVLKGPCFTRAKITAPKLKSLEILGFFNYDLVAEIVLCTPKLEFVIIDGVVPSLISNHHFPSLHKVECSLISIDIIYMMYVEKQQLADRIRGLLKLFQNADSLILDSAALEVLSNFSTSVVEEEAFIFRKLKNLRLKEDDDKP